MKSGAHHFARMNSLVFSGQDAFPHQRHDPRRNNLGLHPEITPAIHIAKQRAGHITGSNLNRIPIFQQIVGDLHTDSVDHILLFLRKGLGRDQRGRRTLAFDQAIDVRHMNRVRSAGSDKTRINLGNHPRGPLRHQRRHAHARAETTVAVPVGRRHRHQIHVQVVNPVRQGLRPEIGDRHIVELALVEQGPFAPAQIPRLEVKVCVEAGQVPVKQGHQRIEAQAPQAFPIFDQRSTQRKRRPGQAGGKNTVRRLDAGKRVSRTHQFIATPGLPSHIAPHSRARRPVTPAAPT